MTTPYPQPVGRGLRLALFAEQGHPDGAFRSGVTRVTSHIVEGAERNGATVDFFTYHDDSEVVGSGSVRYVSARPRIPVSFHGLTVDAMDIVPAPNARLMSPTDGRDYDVVVGTSPGIGTQGQLLARRRAIPYVNVYTTDLPHYAAELIEGRLRSLPGARTASRWARRGSWALLQWMLHPDRTDLVLVPTDPVRHELEARVKGRVEVWGRGADTLDFEAPSPSIRPRGRLLYVGRIDYGQKNLQLLERCEREIPDADVVAVGGGDDLPLLRERLATEIADGRVRVTGHIDDPERLRDEYESADVFVFPSLLDTLGQVVLEAQKAALPVVCRDRGGPPTLIVDGHTGYAATTDDDFVDRARSLVDDRHRRVLMGMAAHRHASAMPGWTDVVDTLYARLGQLVASRTSTARPAA